MNTLRIGSPLDKAIDIGAIVAQRPARAHPAAGGSRRRGRSHLLAAFHSPAFERAVISTYIAEQRSSRFGGGAARDFRPRAGGDDVSNAARGRGARQQHGYGLAACVWSESINVSLHVAAQLKAGVVWVNCTNLLTPPAVRRLPRERLRPRRRARRLARISRACLV